MRQAWRWILVVAAVLVLSAAVLAVDYATRDDDGDGTYQGVGTGGEGNPIQVTANQYGHVWTTTTAEAAPVAKTLTPLVKEVAASGTAVPLVASETFARMAYLTAKKTAGANTGLVYIGDSTVDVAGPQQNQFAPGDFIVIDFGPGTKFDLALVYIDCAAGNTDGVSGWYVAP